MQVLNSACAYADNEYHSTIEAFFEGAWDEATDHRPFLTSLLCPPSPFPPTSMVREEPGVQDYMHCCMYFKSTVQLHAFT